ncbi:MAG: TonB-dependent receptor [Steroidobacteraceae bacterium]
MGRSMTKCSCLKIPVHLHFLVSAAAAVLCFPAATLSGAATVGPANDQLEEIVVTAEKRESTVQKTPISITAITGKDLEGLGINNAQAIVQAVPGIAVASAGPGQAKYEIRGLSSDGGEAATIGFYLDDIPITPPATATTGKSAIDPGLYDLGRVEVLRGPQGTLYGASSMGGTVKLVTSAPDFSKTYGSSETTGSGTVSGGANYGENVMFNVPLVDEHVALRIVGTYTHTSGWIDRIVVPNFPISPDGGTTRGQVANVPGSTVSHGVNDEDLANARLELLIKPNDQLTIKPAIFFQNIRQGGMNTFDSVPGSLTHYEAFDVSEPFRDQFSVVSLPISYALGPVELTSVTGYWTRHIRQQQDATEQFVTYVPFPAFNIADGGPGPSYATEVDELHQVSQEVRIASTAHSRFDWLAGLYYSDYHDNFTTWSAPPGVAAQPEIYGTAFLYNVTEPLHVRQEAIFAHAGFGLTDSLKVEGGLRYFWYQNEFDSVASGYLYNSVTPELSFSSAAQHGVNPMINISDQVTSNVMVYASAAKGFREGAGNFPISTTGPGGAACLASLEAIGLKSAPTSFNPDSVWSFELGEKARIADQRIILNSDIYDIRWSDVQTPVALSCGLGYTTNGPHAEIRGGEAELEIQILQGLTLSQSVGYAHGVYTQNFAAASIVDGQPLLNAPHWTASSVLRFERPVGDRNVVFQLRNAYTSSSYDLSYQINQLPSRDTMGLRTGLDTKHWSAYLFADNVLNQHQQLENINLLSYTAPPYNRVATNQPLTVGLTVEVGF